MSGFSLDELEKIVAERGRSGDSGSWTAKLFAGGMDRAALEALVATAHEVCPYSNATRGNVDVTLTIV